MLANGDRSARHAFRAGLVEEPSRPNMTQELDASDILEVEDVAAAIARAEGVIKDRASSVGLDVFDQLVRRRATDDASGPALHRPVVPTPVPPAAHAAPPVHVPPPAPVPAAAVLHVPSAPTLPISEDDAYFHPGKAQIRTLADESLQIYRAEPTLMVRARQRRGAFAWVVAAILLPLALVAALGMWFGSAAASVSVAVPPKHIVHAHVHVAPPPPEAKVQAKAAPSFDVKSLPAAKRR